MIELGENKNIPLSITRTLKEVKKIIRKKYSNFYIETSKICMLGLRAVFFLKNKKNRKKIQANLASCDKCHCYDWSFISKGKNGFYDIFEKEYKILCKNCKIIYK